MVTAEVFEKICFGEREGAGIVVVAETPVRGLAQLKELPAEPLVAVIEGVEKPGNVGAILRSADAAGVDAVIVADGGTDLFNPNTIRASLGTVFKANVVEATARGDDCVAAARRGCGRWRRGWMRSWIIRRWICAGVWRLCWGVRRRG